MLRSLTMIAVMLAIPAAFGEPAKRDDPKTVDFIRDVQPLFAKHCYSCHGPSKQKSGLRLDIKKDALDGGDLGKAILPGKGAESPLVRYVAGAVPDMLMPPKGERLTQQQIGVLRAWIDQGASWPDTIAAKEETWWSLKPLARPVVPGDGNPIDAFIRKTLQEKQLKPSAEADRRTLIRRVTFDLIGLPPTPEQVEAFLKDTDPKAFEKVVDRLLASPHYGERWARHWLDVVHYGDTHGYDKDKPRPNAWPYRDYLIRAFNDDRPYARFVQEQIAGDVLFPGNADGIEALGFIAAGPWDFIGHAEVPESKIDGKIARHLDRDDMIANTMMTFASTTVQCAQCHNHKFDPIPQEDYYSLQAVFAALDRADRTYYRDPAVGLRFAQLNARKAELDTKKKELDARIAKLAGPELAELDKQIAVAGKPSPKGERPEFGYHSAIEKQQDRVKWVQVDLGQSQPISEIRYVGCHDDFNQIGAGFGFPARFKIEASDDSKFEKGVVLIQDRTKEDVPNPGVTVQRVGDIKVTARYVRVTATKLALRQNDFIFALAELSVFDSAGKNLSAGATVTALDSIEAPVRWRKSNLVDGYWYGMGNAPAAPLAELQKKRQALLDKAVDPQTRRELSENASALVDVSRELSKLPPPSIVYCGTVHTSGGAFSGTGPFGGKPRPIHVLSRGDVRKPLKEVMPGALTAIKELPNRFEISRERSEGERRAALAHWLTDPKNPLVWRSIVNRMWRYHFGRGIVDTPNDFGKMGQLPTHPELLDWLAADFRDTGGSFKKLHKQIVMSETYRQTSAIRNAECGMRNEMQIVGGGISIPHSAFRIPHFEDADNAYLSRMSRRRLEAEEVRDSVLFVSGKLDPKLYGPAFQDFVIEKPEHSPHYQYHLADPTDPKTFRRAVYRFLVRSQQQPFMTVLDCADPSMQVDKRNETLSALQALALLNNGFMLTMSKACAERVEKLGNDDAGRVRAAFRLALARDPSAAELKTLVEYTQKHGLANTCRVIFNLNEFVFVD